MTRNGSGWRSTRDGLNGQMRISHLPSRRAGDGHIFCGHACMHIFENFEDVSPRPWIHSIFRGSIENVSLMLVSLHPFWFEPLYGQIPVLDHPNPVGGPPLQYSEVAACRRAVHQIYVQSLKPNFFSSPGTVGRKLSEPVLG